MVNANYKDLYYFHRKGKFGITLVASTRTHEIPYGVCKLSKKGTLELIDEKPKFSFLANIGLYVVNPELLKYIPKDKYYDFTDFVKDLISKKISMISKICKLLSVNDIKPSFMKVKNVTIPIKIHKNEDKIIQLKFFIILNILNKH